MTQQQPPSEPKQHPCRCETCEHKGEYTPFGSDCPLNGYEWSAFQIECITMHIGCASHSANTGAQARVDAVMLLNTLIARFMVANQKGQGRPWNIQHIQSLIETFRDVEAIALLKEGVGK